MSRSNHNYRTRRISERTFATRRGLFRSRERFPRWSIKSWHPGPGKWLKDYWRRRARAIQNQQMLDEDPVITPMKRLIEIWDWY